MSPLPARVSLSAALAAGTVVASVVPAFAVDGATALQSRPAVRQPAAHTTRAPGVAPAAPVVVGAPTALAAPVVAAAAPAEPAAMTYQVQAGDSVWAIAQRTGASTAAIIAANGLDSRALIRTGQMLLIPSPAGSTAAPAPAAPVAAPTTHTIARGETLSGIAARYGTTVAALMSANGLTTTTIYAGRTLQIGTTAAVAPAAAPAAQAPAPAAPVAAPTTHTIARGETLSGIAARYGTTVAALMSANGLTTTTIYAGRTLQIGTTATVAPAAPTQLVPSTFLHYTYPQATVSAANANKAALLASGVPSRDQMRTMVRQTALAMGVDPALALAIAMKESGFNHASVSPANAIGTMQVIPSSGAWASDLVGRQLNLLDPADNVTAGVAIIRQLVRTSSSLEIAIASYYQGAGSVKRNGMFSDTQSYVAGVRAYMTQFGG